MDDAMKEAWDILFTRWERLADRKARGVIMGSGDDR